jgi:RNA polymerase sigma-70 factor (ECF subfamily)
LIFLFWNGTRHESRLSIFEFACVWWFMSASQAVFAGWMEIPSSAVDELARTESARVRAEEEALAALVSEYAGTLYRVSFSVLRNAADAEDAVQEAFLRVLRHRDTLDEVRDRRVWLIRIVWNIVLDRKRRAKTRPETDDVAELARVLPAEGLSAEDRAAAAQHHAQVLACVETLPAKEREVLMLSAFEELTSVEIAQVLGITESSVRSRLFRARNLMAGLLGRERTGNRD